MDIIDNAVSKTLDRSVHEVNAHLHIGTRSAESECLEEEHCTTYDAEVCPDGRMLEETPR